MEESGSCKANKVQAIFKEIASRYDRVNRTISFCQDHKWRRFAVAQAGLKPGDRLLDVACGTGMMCFEAARQMKQGKIVGIDFSESMLEQARNKIAGTPLANVIEFQQGDALKLPFSENSFQAGMMAFGLRNVSDICCALTELRRVVEPGGKVVVLDLGRPQQPVFRQIYFYYLQNVLPVIGRWSSGRNVYGWLPESLVLYPNQQQLCQYFYQAGLTDVKYFDLCGGIVAVHVGTVPKSSKRGESLWLN